MWCFHPTVLAIVFLDRGVYALDAIMQWSNLHMVGFTDLIMGMFGTKQQSSTSILSYGSASAFTACSHSSSPLYGMRSMNNNEQIHITIIAKNIIP